MVIHMYMFLITLKNISAFLMSYNLAIHSKDTWHIGSKGAKNMYKNIHLRKAILKTN